MDRFPQYPPHDESDVIPASDMDALRMWILLIGGTAAWVLALLAAGYWIAGAAPDLGAYLHGVLVGVLVGIAYSAAYTRKSNSRDRTTQ